MRQSCGGLLFTSDFDSGNLAKVEFVPRHGRYCNPNGCVDSGNNESPAVEESSKTNTLCSFRTVSDALCIRGNVQNSTGNQVKEEHDLKGLGVRSTNQMLEYNIWITPDCAGTPYENTNRTWFYFGVQGDAPDCLLKINVMNMNRQSKLFSHGMTPVYKIVPGKEKWNRISRKPIVQGQEGSNFILSFCHKLPSDSSATIYFAFTFPFTYEECQDMLNKIDSKYLAGEYKSECSSEDDIYYHREVACYSLDGHRLDVLTITSHHGKLDELEGLLPHLFPDTPQKRCHLFEGKRVVFISSRVHPGETPSSFVFNGVLHFLLSTSDIRAVILRRKYVFKLIPMLNPDGVVRGHYRTDSRGINLNRLYLGANILLYPTIYAARTLLLYYHRIYAVEDSESSSNIISSSLSSPNLENDMPDCLQEMPINSSQDASSQIQDKKKNNEISLSYNDASHKLRSGDIDINSVENARSNIRDKELLTNGNKAKYTCQNVIKQDKQKDYTLKQTNVTVTGPNRTRFLQRNNYEHSANERIIRNLENSKSNNGTKSCNLLEQKEENSAVNNRTEKCMLLSATYTKEQVCKTNQKNLLNVPGGNNGEKFNSRAPSDNEDINDANCDDTSCVANSYRIEFGITPNEDIVNLESLNIPMLPPERSGIAYYIDLHGHASKRGCFFYGNFFSDLDKKVESWALAKLMSLNSPHFDYSACNFSTHNMYAGGKREGQSKKGSGRVALYLLTGIIHCYTLECNYNTGKYVNSIIKRGEDGNIELPIHLPGKAIPYYSPTVYQQQVGKSLLVSILDATRDNPLSRLPSTSYENIDGVHNWLFYELDPGGIHSIQRNGKCHSWSSGYGESHPNISKDTETKQEYYNKYNLSNSKEAPIYKSSETLARRNKTRIAFASTSPSRGHQNLIDEGRKTKKDGISRDESCTNSKWNKIRHLSKGSCFAGNVATKSNLNQRNVDTHRNILAYGTTPRSTVPQVNLQRQWESINKRNSFPITKCTFIPTLNILSLFTERKIPPKGECLERSSDQRTVQNTYKYGVKAAMPLKEGTQTQVSNSLKENGKYKISDNTNENHMQLPDRDYIQRRDSNASSRELSPGRDHASPYITTSSSGDGDCLPQISLSASKVPFSNASNNVNTNICTVELPRLSEPNVEVTLCKTFRVEARHSPK